MRNIAIIPARSGSKGLPDKNIKVLNGKPLMAYSIEAAIRSGCFDKIMVSTDSLQYRNIAMKYGAEVPFLRSAHASSDLASTWDVVDEVLRGYDNLDMRYDTVCVLQPTSPLRNEDDVKKAYMLYEGKNAIAVISMTELEHPIEWCGKVDKSLSLDGFCNRNGTERRQQVDKSFRPNGAIFIVSVQQLRQDRFLYRDGAYAYIMPADRSIDIDTELDFRYAEFLMREKGNEKY